MTASEFAFMALGLVLGVATGAALVEVLRSRPPAPREVRVTVTPNSVRRRRATTLADPTSAGEPAGPARGGPGDRRWLDRDMPAGNDPTAPVDRTPVSSGPPPQFRLAGAGPSSVGIAIAREPDPMMAALRAASAARARVLMPSGIESSSAEAAFRMAAVAPARQVQALHLAEADKTSDDDTSAPGAAQGGPSASGADAPAQPGAPAPPPAPGSAPGDAIAGACDEPKRIAEERCLVATRAREGAQSALEALRSAQRGYDEHSAQADEQATKADPRAVREAKEAAQQAFRVARTSGRSRDDVESAAREWLTEINRINLATREAGALAERHRVAANELAQRLERLAVESDAARISAEAAEEACVAAREAFAACQEAAAAVSASGRKSVAPAAPPFGGAPRTETSDDEADSGRASRAGEDAVIIKLLRGDREALGRLVARLGGDDPDERRRWQTSIGDLLEAFVARSIEASAFDFPSSHPFWGPFTRSQCRDIAAALSSLGYRHDGFGSWADDHMPTQRDLSLAVGYAGLDPMRIRHWPSESEMEGLLREVTVAADEYVWEAAGTLTLGELVSLLGRRADGLTELWNEWGIVRPLLLAVE